MPIKDKRFIRDDGLLSGLNYKGTWDANANTPALGDNGAGGIQGDYYIVGTDGTTSIDGENDWVVGDWITHNGSNWQKIDNTSTGAGGNSLDMAYDWGGSGAGRVITADQGAVRVNNAVADATNALEVNRTTGTGDALTVIAGNIGLATTSRIKFGDAERYFTDNGTDISMVNSTVSGDILINATGTTADVILDATRKVELDGGVSVSLDIAGTPQLITTAGHLLITAGTALEFGTTTKKIYDNATQLKFENAASNGDTFIITTRNIELQPGGSLSTTQFTTTATNMTTLIPLTFGGATRNIVDNGTDLLISNTTVSGDIILDSTRLIEIDAGVNAEVHIAGVRRVSITSTGYIEQFAGNDYDHAIDVYSSNGSHSPRLKLRKSASATLETLAQTNNGERLGEILFQGVTGGSAWQIGATIEAVQNGATSTYIPADLYLFTHSPTVINTNQFVLRNDGNVEINLSADDATLDVQTFSVSVGQASGLNLNKSASATIGTFVETIDTDILGFINFKGVDNGNNSDTGATILAIQNGAAGVKVPTDLKFSTYSSTAQNADQFILHNDGTVSITVTAERMVIDAQNFTLKKASADNNFYLDAYSTTNSHTNNIFIRKSDNGTLGTPTQTDDGDVLGKIRFQGVDSGNVFDEGAFIIATQNGASGGKVPTDLVLGTYSNSAENTDQFVLRSDGSIEFNAGDLKAMTGNKIIFNDGSDDDFAAEYVVSTTTADGVATTIDTITITNDDEMVSIVSHIAGYKTDGSEVVHYVITGVFRRNGAGAVQVGTTTSIDTENSEAVTSDADYALNGNDVLTQVTGVNPDSWKWTCKQQYVYVD